MAMSFTPSDFQQVKFFVCLSVANKLRIPNAESNRRNHFNSRFPPIIRHWVRLSATFCPPTMPGIDFT